MLFLMFINKQTLNHDTRTPFDADNVQIYAIHSKQTMCEKALDYKSYYLSILLLFFFANQFN